MQRRGALKYMILIVVFVAIFAAIIIGAVGATMDVGMDIAASLTEIYHKNPDIGMRELARSGFTIGRDIMGTMSNTLVLAYIGSGLHVTLLFMTYYDSLETVLNVEMMTNEVLQALAGSIGIVFTIPTTTLATVFLYALSRKRQQRKAVKAGAGGALAYGHFAGGTSTIYQSKTPTTAVSLANVDGHTVLTPEEIYAANLGAAVGVNGDKALLFGAVLTGQGRTYWDEANTASQPFYAQLALHAGIQWGQTGLKLWCRNVTNTRYATFAFSSAASGQERWFAQRGNPIQAGIDIHLRF